MTLSILVPLDGSDLAESALPLEVAMARLTSSGITLLRAVPISTPTPALTAAERPIGTFTCAGKLRETEEEEVSVARAYLDTIGKRLEDGGLQVHTEIVQDLPATAIAEYAEQDPSIWLIAMATKHLGPSSVSCRFGSIAERVLHTTHKPVLLVRSPMNGVPNKVGKAGGPEEAEEHSFAEPALEKIIVPLDGSRYAEDALEQARQIALLTGATLVLVCAIPPSCNGEIDQSEFISISEDIARGHEAARLTRYLTDTAEQLRVEGLEVLTELVYGHAAEMILLAALRLHGDLIVMAAQGKRDRERLWLGSVAQKLVQGSTLPVLLMRTAELYAI